MSHLWFWPHSPLSKQTVLIYFFQWIKLLKKSEIKHGWLFSRKISGDEGSKQVTFIFTKSLKSTFVVAKNFLVERDGDEADAGNINYTSIQEFFPQLNQ